MSEKVAIVTDSTATIPEELIKQYSIHVAPQVLIWGEETFRDGVDIQADEFYTRLKTASVMPTTSQVSPATLMEIFTDLDGQGYQILAIFVSEKLSGTMSSARQAVEMLPGVRVEIVDSYSTSMAMGFHVLAAARAAGEGASLAACKAIAEQARDTTGIFLTVETLEFLHRGGRIGGGARFLGTALNIKPILELREGRLEAVERIRTRSKALRRVSELTVDQIGGRKPVRLAALHADAPGEAQQLMEDVARVLNPIESITFQLSPVVGTHVGPGTVGLVYMAGM